MQLDEVFNESGANMSVISSSHSSDTSEDGNYTSIKNACVNQVLNKPKGVDYV